MRRVMVRACTVTVLTASLVIGLPRVGVAESNGNGQSLRPSTVDRIIEQLNDFRSQQQQNLPKTTAFQLKCQVQRGLRCEFVSVKRFLGPKLTKRLADRLLSDLGVMSRARIKCRRDKVGRRHCAIDRGKGYTPVPVKPDTKK